LIFPDNSLDAARQGSIKQIKNTITATNALSEGITLPENLRENMTRSEQKRVLYASGQNKMQAKNGEKIEPEEGEAITEDLACDLKNICWGGSDKPLKATWTKQGLVFHPEQKLFAYGLKMPTNEVKNFLICIQAYLLKQLLFGEDPSDGKKKSNARKYNKNKKEEKLTEAAIEKKLQPKQRAQKEMIIEGVLDVIFKAAGGENGIFCIPGDKNCFEPTQRYLSDTITEKLHLFTCKDKDNMRPVIQQFYDVLVKEAGVGTLILLYSIILSKGFDKIKDELQDKVDIPLVDLDMAVCADGLLNLVITGQATPYVHNSWAFVNGDAERKGFVGRSEFGMLLSKENPLFKLLGVYMKTPILPIWLTKCEGQMGLIFNPNKDLLKSKGMENKFNLYYFANYEFDKTETPKQTLITIDSRGGQKEEVAGFDEEDTTPPLETAIHSKWEDAGIDWNDTEPYIW